jgi:hypothetical protein
MVAMLAFYYLQLRFFILQCVFFTKAIKYVIKQVKNKNAANAPCESTLQYK